MRPHGKNHPVGIVLWSKLAELPNSLMAHDLKPMISSKTIKG
jgi:hypothetical protein